MTDGALKELTQEDNWPRIAVVEAGGLAAPPQGSR
jgi:hypothetical protein